MKTLSLLALIALSISCVPSTETEKASSANINKSAPYLWQDNAFPKNLMISGDFSVNETTAISDMSTAWKTALENKVTFFGHSGGTTLEKSNTLNSMDDMLDDTMGVYKTVTWPESLPGTALAVTQIFGRRYNIGTAEEFVDIEHADILVNYDGYDFYTTAKDPNLNEFDLRTVLLHEMGHFLGLQHVDSTNSVMITSVAHTTVNRAPKSLDKAELADKYSISLNGSSSAIIAGHRTVYRKETQGEEVRILIELHADGECVHKENGSITVRHSTDHF